MTQLTFQPLLQKLRSLKPTLAQNYKVRALGLFGSWARGEQQANSDVDVLVELTEGADLFDLIGLTLFLEETLQCKVDVVSKHALRAELREAVLQELVAI